MVIFSTLLSSVKNSLLKLRPCLIIRLGLACVNLTSTDKPRFAQAVVSKVEYGVLHLVEPQNPQIVVFTDCDGLSPLGFPMQMMRSIAVLLQDHYPNCLDCLFIVRLPPVARVIITTLTQVLKPVTRKKLRIIGEDYRRVLSDYLETLPYFLGGPCKCPKCKTVLEIPSTSIEAGTDGTEWQNLVVNSDDDAVIHPLGGHAMETEMPESCEHVLRTAIVAALMIWILIAFIICLHDPQLCITLLKVHT